MTDRDRIEAALGEQSGRAVSLLGLVLLMQPLAVLLASFAVRPWGAAGPLELSAPLAVFAATGLALLAGARRREGQRWGAHLVIAALMVIVVTLAWAESPHRTDGGPSLMPLAVLVGLAILPLRPAAATGAAALLVLVFLLAVASLPFAEPMSSAARQRVLSSTLPSGAATVATVAVVAAALHRERVRGIEASLERDDLVKASQAQAEVLAARHQELLAAQTELVRRRHLASVGQLVAGVAHELNTPLGALQSAQQVQSRAARALADEPPSAPRRRSALEAIRTSVETAAAATDRVTTVVRRLRCFARLDEASDQEVDVRDCLDAAVAVLERSLSGVTLTVEARTGPHRVRGDPQALNQVFFELLANAAEATGSKGHITARIRATEAAVEAEVEDDGPGLSAEHLDRLFDPGFTTKAPGVGVGLGLASAHAIVTEHGGTIAAEPREGRGARFVVRLPASKVG